MNNELVVMSTGAMSLAFEIYECVKATSWVVSKGIERFERPLVEAIPLLGRLQALRVLQLEKSVQHLQEQTRIIDITQDPERLLGFSNMSFRYFEAGAREHREVKLRMLAAACARCADVENTDSFDLELDIFDVVERLQPFHFRILYHLDSYYAEKRLKGEDERKATASFEGVKHLVCESDPNDEEWFTKALLALRDLTAVRIEGAEVLRTGGRRVPVAEPEAIVQSGKIALGPFGSKLLSYVRNGCSEPDKPVRQ